MQPEELVVNGERSWSGHPSSSAQGRLSLVCRGRVRRGGGCHSCKTFRSSTRNTSGPPGTYDTQHQWPRSVAPHALDEQVEHAGGLGGVGGGEHDSGEAGRDVLRPDIVADRAVSDSSRKHRADGGVELLTGLGGRDRPTGDDGA